MDTSTSRTPEYSGNQRQRDRDECELADFNTCIKEKECRCNLISRQTRVAKRGGESKAMQ